MHLFTVINVSPPFKSVIWPLSQIGSTVKPFLYTYAMEEGFTPCDQFLNAQPVILDANGREWA
ncbi:MAG: hypothetical protein IIW83_03770, partial [Clostridia bacterium]|nr:hypothetical protein [Clostridia bacterium]